MYSNYRADLSLDEYLKQNNIVGIEGIDTRALTRSCGSTGAMRGVLSTRDSRRRGAGRARAERSADGRGRLGEGGQAEQAYEWDEDQGDWGRGRSSAATGCTSSRWTAGRSTTSCATSPSAA